MTEQESEYAPGWKPEPGDEIEGRIIGIDARERKRPKPGETHYPILTLEKANGEQVAVHAFHSVLEREIKENFRPSEIVGSHIKIRFEGERETRDGENTYFAYKVYGGTRRVANVASVLNWSDDETQQPAPTVSAQQTSIPIAPAPVPVQGSHLIPDPSPVAPSPTPPTVQEKAAESFGSEPPF